MRSVSIGKTPGSEPRSEPLSSPSPMLTLVRRHDRDRFHTVLFAPAAHREALLALYAFNYEVARVRETVSEPMLGRIRLQWWREAIDTACSGGAPRDHPVVAAITATIRAYRLGRAPFDRLIDTRERDLDEAPPADLAALVDYAEGSAATLATLALDVLGIADQAAGEAARHVAIAFGLIGMVRAERFRAGRLRSLLPAAVPVRDIAAAAATHLAAARALRAMVPRPALPVLLPAVIAGHTLKRLERAGFDPFAAAPDDPLQSWRLALAALRRRF